MATLAALKRSTVAHLRHRLQYEYDYSVEDLESMKKDDLVALLVEQDTAAMEPTGSLVKHDPHNLQDEPQENYVDALENAHGPLYLPGPNILHWDKALPNLITCLATCFGLSSVRVAETGNFQLAVLFIMIAGGLDGMDGPVARALHTTSRFGAELDSISDVMNFGVAPALVIHNIVFKGWVPPFDFVPAFLQTIGIDAGWIVCLLITIAVGCRLARFNAGIDFNASKKTKAFFMGVPAPCVAAMVSAPLMAHFARSEVQWFDGLLKAANIDLLNATFNAAWIVFCSYMAVSRIPTISTKFITREGFRDKVRGFRLVLFYGVLATMLLQVVFHPWSVGTVLITIYVSSFPFTYLAFKRVVSSRRVIESGVQQKAKRSSSPASRS